MKALAAFPDEKSVRLIDLPEPGPLGPSDVRLRVLDVGICGTDREIAAFLYGTPPAGSPHLVMGHESLGEVVEVGAAVTNVAVGDLAIPMVRRPCPHLYCRPCRDGRQDFCVTGDFLERGIKGAPGYLAGQVVDDERYFVRVPKELRDVAVLVEPLTIAEKAADQVSVLLQRIPGNLEQSAAFRRAVVLGAGPVGLLGAMKLVESGWETWVYSKGDPSSPSAEVATALGARFVSSDAHDPASLAEMVGSISLVYEATGAARVSFDVMSVLGVNGVFVFTGVPGRKGPIELDADLIMRNLVLKNQVVVGTVNAGRADFEAAVRDIEAFLGSFPEAVRALITARIPFDGAREAVLSPPPGIKTVVEVG